MRVCVVGAGAIGATIGARLAASGHDVSLVARGANLEAIRSKGLRFVDHVAEQSGTYRLAASAEPVDFGPQDCVFLTVKAHQLPELLVRCTALLGPQTVVVPAINGLPWWYFYRVGGRWEGVHLTTLDPQGRMLSTLPGARILGCVVHLAAEQREPGEVHCTAGRRLILGEPDNSESERLRSLAAHLQTAGFVAECSRDIRRDIWVKLIGNLSFNPVAALTGYRMDQICADEQLLDVIRAILTEGTEVAASYGIDVAITPQERIGIARQLGAARISMLQDLENRRSLELAPIVGAVLELAERSAVQVPITRSVYALIRARAHALNLPLA
ncbi:MAG TPA: 2-dehydropantoate 2-reductase [Burkholderiaceae bacterium]|nr:2-dehydropantoate 2-reductase [Burkholderiaceae bacterium]